MRRIIYKKYLVIPIAVLFIGFGLTFMASRYVFLDEKGKAQLELDESIEDLESKIDNELSRYETLLLGTKGLFQSSDFVSRQEFSSFINGAIDVDQRFSPINSVSFVEYAPNYLGAIEIVEEIKSEPVFNDVDLSDVELQPSFFEGEAYIPKYLEPLPSNKPFLGFNLATLPGRSDAYKRSLDTNSVTSFDNVELLTGKIGFTINKAVESNGTLSGVTVAVIESENFFEKLYADSIFENIKFNIEAPSVNKTVYTTGMNSEDGILISASRQYKFDQTKFNLYVSKPFFINSQVYQTALLGFTLTIFAGFVGFFIVRSRHLAILRADSITHEHENERLFFKSLISNVSGGVIVHDALGNIIECSNDIYQIIDNKQSIVGKNISQIIKSIENDIKIDTNKNQIKSLMDLLSQGVKNTAIKILHSPSGKYYECDYVPIVQGSQTLGGYWFFRDITEYKKIQLQSKKKEKGLEEINQAFIGRELRIRELKKQLKELKNKK